MHPLAANYIIFSILLLLLFAVKGFKIKRTEHDVLFIFISFIVLAILHVYVEINSVDDLPAYLSAFNRIGKISYPYYLDVFKKGDPLYAILNKMIYIICDDFYFFLLLYNILLLGSHYYIFNRYSPNVPISIIIFLAMFFNQSLFVLRQYIAISLLILSIPCIINKKIIPLMLLCVMAFFIHKSALLFVPLIFLYYIKSKTTFITVIIVMIMLSSVISIDFIFDLISSFDYDEYFDLEAQQNFTAKMITASYLIMYVISLKKHIFDDGINRLCFIGILLYAMGYAFVPAVGPITRLLKYYELFVMFAVPITVKYMKMPILRLIYLSAIIISQGYLTIRDLSELYFSRYQMGSINLLYLSILLIVDYIVVYKFIHNKGTTKPKRVIQDTYKYPKEIY